MRDNCPRRVLFIFFGGTTPAIRDLHLETSFNDLTADIKEAWASCFWTIQVCLEAARRNRESPALMKSIESLARRLYAITQLQDAELSGRGITGVIGAMSARYAKRLGFDPAAIEKGHSEEIAKLGVERKGSGQGCGRFQSDGITDAPASRRPRQ